MLRALPAGAAGFLLNDTPRAEIVRAIELVTAVESMLSTSVGRRLITLVAGDQTADARRENVREKLADLSRRERKISAYRPRRSCERPHRRRAPHERDDGQGLRLACLMKLDVDNGVQIALLVQEAQH